MEKTVLGSCTFGTVEAYTLRNENGMEAVILTLGGAVQKLLVPTEQGKLDVCLGYDTAEEYGTGGEYYGALIGRVANRISGAAFELSGTRYVLPANEGRHLLHGGPDAFEKKLWIAEPEAENTLTLSYRSPDGENGFPGTLDITVRYTLTGDNALRIDYTASADRDTPVNLTNHTYFNLNGGRSVLDHKLWIDAERFTVVNSEMIPTGERMPVDGTSMDFRTEKPLGRDIADGAVKKAGLYDHNYCLNGSGLRRVAVLRGESLTMEVETTAPGLQLYCEPYLSEMPGKTPYKGYCFVCLEAQGYPDAVNRPEFPGVILPAGQTYRQTTVYRFI